MRVRRKKWAQSELETNERIIKNPEEWKGRWSERFGNSNPIHLEIGCGKSRFVITMAGLNPQINYVGLERERHVIVMGARAAEESPPTLFFALADAGNLEDMFAVGEVSRIYLNFSDPWPGKKKWRKRRLTHEDFLDKYARLMGSGGELFFKTDNRELFEFSIEEFSKRGWLIQNVSLDLAHSGMEGNVLTEYEERFMSLGMPIYRLEAIFRP